MYIQVYRAILGLRENEPVGEMYHASAGLLLDPALHKAFDRLDFSFYYRVSTYQIVLVIDTECCSVRSEWHTIRALLPFRPSERASLAWHGHPPYQVQYSVCTVLAETRIPTMALSTVPHGAYARVLGLSKSEVAGRKHYVQSASRSKA
jgi:hypothetical protein